MKFAYEAHSHNGYKYRLNAGYNIQLPPNLWPRDDTSTSFIMLSTLGTLIIMAGYMWGGPSGIIIDTPSFMRGSLVHDALYQLCREGHLNHITQRKAADELLWKLCRDDGMPWWRASYIYRAVRLFGARSARPIEQEI